MVLLNDTDLNDALDVAERIRLAVSEHTIPVGLSLLNFTVSIGAASFIEDDKTWYAAINRADQAMYNAKNLGRNKVMSS